MSQRSAGGKRQPVKAKLVQDKKKKNVYTFVSIANDQDDNEERKSN